MRLLDAVLSLALALAFALMRRRWDAWGACSHGQWRGTGKACHFGDGKVCHPWQKLPPHRAGLPPLAAPTVTARRGRQPPEAGPQADATDAGTTDAGAGAGADADAREAAGAG